MDETEEFANVERSRSKRELDVVAPGEEDVENNKQHAEFNKSATTMKSWMSATGEREKWGSKTQFLMSLIASAVGLGNVWRFPSVCARNGGAAFLIPYLIVLTIVARPIFVMELALGQFSSKGSVRVWDMSPIFTGIGVTGCVSSVLLSTFYIMLLAWALIYTVISFIGMCKGEVLWGDDAGAYFGGKVLEASSFNSENNMEVGPWTPVCHLVLALIIAWMLIWASMVMGLEASGKVAYVTAMAPYVVLFILLGVGCSLEGAWVGIKYFLVPTWGKILDPETWFQAVGQCFFSLGIGFGGCIMFASFNEFDNNITNDVLLIALVDTFTSVLAGLSLMSILGFQATLTLSKMQENDGKNITVKNNNTAKAYRDVQDNCRDTRTMELSDLKICTLESLVKEGGAGVAFVQYPAAMREVDKQWGGGFGGFLGMLFFLMLILLAVGSANGFVGTTVTIIADRKPQWKRSNIVSGVCLVSFFMGLVYTNGMGSEWFDVVDYHGVTAVLYVLAFLEAVAVTVVYGLKNFCDDLEFMRGGKPVGWYLKITWVTLPIFMPLVYVMWLVNYKAVDTWTTIIKVFAWCLTGLVLSVIPATACYKLYEFWKEPWKKDVPHEPFAVLKAVYRPSPKWGPKNPELRTAWKAFKAQREPTYNIPAKIHALLTCKLCKKAQVDVKQDKPASVTESMNLESGPASAISGMSDESSIIENIVAK